MKKGIAIDTAAALALALEYADQAETLAADIRTAETADTVEVVLSAVQLAADNAAHAARIANTAAAHAAADRAAAALASAKWGANLTRFELAYASGDYTAELYTLAAAIAYSVVNKTIDPQKKNAVKREEVSNSGYNAAMVQVKRDIAADLALLDNVRTAHNAAYILAYDKDGNIVSIVVDPDSEKAAAALQGETLGDGADLVNIAAAALLAQAADHATSLHWLEDEYTITGIKRRVLIQAADTAAVEAVSTSPIVEAYREVRRAIASSRAVAADPRNGYSYIEDLADNGEGKLETVYRRLCKYADMGGSCHTGHFDGSGADVHGGMYTTDTAAVMEYDAVLDRLNLTARQAEILRYRVQGYGYESIASFLGVNVGTVRRTLDRMRVKCKDMGFIPTGNNAARIARESSLRTILELDTAAAAADRAGDTERADRIYSAIADECDTHGISRAALRMERENIARKISADLRAANAMHRQADTLAAADRAAADRLRAAAIRMEEEAYAAADLYGITAAMLNNI